MSDSDENRTQDGVNDSPYGVNHCNGNVADNGCSQDEKHCGLHPIGWVLG